MYGKRKNRLSLSTTATQNHHNRAEDITQTLSMQWLYLPKPFLLEVTTQRAQPTPQPACHKELAPLDVVKALRGSRQCTTFWCLVACCANASKKPIYGVLPYVLLRFFCLPTYFAQQPRFTAKTLNKNAKKAYQSWFDRGLSHPYVRYSVHNDDGIHIGLACRPFL